MDTTNQNNDDASGFLAVSIVPWNPSEKAVRIPKKNTKRNVVKQSHNQKILPITNNNNNNNMKQGSENINPQTKASIIGEKRKLPMYSGSETYCYRCKNTHCLRKYCNCRANGNFCGNLCGCENCKNRVQFISDPDFIQAERVRLKEAKKKRKGEIGRCNCTARGCTARYCICKRSGKQCTHACRCINCENC